jgi:RNA polymerase sigma-70 factor (ECF subfamily)
MEHQPEGFVMALICRIREGHTQALGELMEKYRSYLLHETRDFLTRSGLQKRIGAEDVVQEVCLRVFRRFPSFQGSTEPEFTSWVNAIRKKILIDECRKHNAECRDWKRDVPLQTPTDSASVVIFEPAADQSTPSQRVIRGESALLLINALGTLPEDQRTAVRLRHFEGLGREEIAERMGNTTSAVAGLICRGLVTLEKLLGDLL